eukprot:709826-Prorocentrum_minimum.AAC.1
MVSSKGVSPGCRCSCQAAKARREAAMRYRACGGKKGQEALNPLRNVGKLGRRWGRNWENGGNIGKMVGKKLGK